MLDAASKTRAPIRSGVFQFGPDGGGMMYVGCCGLPIFSFPSQYLFVKPIHSLYRLISAVGRVDELRSVIKATKALFFGFARSSGGCHCEVEKLLFWYSGLKTAAAAGLVRPVCPHHDQLIGTH